MLPFLMQTIIVLNDSHFLLTNDDAQIMGAGWRSPMNYTKHLWLDDTVVQPDLAKIFQRCPNVFKLALSETTLVRLLDEEIQRDLRSEDLEINVYRSSTKPSQVFMAGSKYHSHPFLHRITKLTVGDIPDCSQFDLSSFPRLTQLNIRFYGHVEELLALLSTICRIQTLVKMIISLPREGFYASSSSSSQGSLSDIIRRRSLEDGRLFQSKTTFIGWPSWKADVEQREVFSYGTVIIPENVL